MPITQLTDEALKDLMASEPGLVVVDVRTPEEYHYLGRIPGSKLIPLHELPRRHTELDPQAKTVLYCQHGVRSMDASHYLQHLGFAALYNLADGFEPWAMSGANPVEK